MKKRVVKVGSSAAVTVSPAELRELGVSVGDEVDVACRGGVLEVRAADKYHGLSDEELFAVISERRIAA